LYLFVEWLNFYNYFQQFFKNQNLFSNFLLNNSQEKLTVKINSRGEKLTVRFISSWEKLTVKIKRLALSLIRLEFKKNWINANKWIKR